MGKEYDDGYLDLDADCCCDCGGDLYRESSIPGICQECADEVEESSLKED